MILNIACDVDGCLRDFQAAVRRMAKEHLNLNYKGEYWSEMFNMDYKGRSLGSFVFNEWAEEIFTTAPVFEENLKAYRKLVDHPKMNVFIVTTQSEDHQQYTIDWLNNNGVEGYERIYFLKDKTKAPTNVLIDDKYENIKSYIDASRLGYLIDRPYNKHGQVLYRMKNINEVYKDLLRFV